ncbi:MAG: hypothetical protein LBM13_01690 [Candidatus Ancillula sp.]|jgi:VCBS repeat-containing protein|nr:hypothetical protein [Candidatus Ancillula sp.]
MTKNNYIRFAGFLAGIAFVVVALVASMQNVTKASAVDLSQYLTLTSETPTQTSVVVDFKLMGSAGIGTQVTGTYTVTPKGGQAQTKNYTAYKNCDDYTGSNGQTATCNYGSGSFEVTGLTAGTDYTIALTSASTAMSTSYATNNNPVYNEGGENDYVAPDCVKTVTNSQTQAKEGDNKYGYCSINEDGSYTWKIWTADSKQTYNTPDLIADGITGVTVDVTTVAKPDVPDDNTEPTVEMCKIKGLENLTATDPNCKEVAPDNSGDNSDNSNSDNSKNNDNSGDNSDNSNSDNSTNVPDDDKTSTDNSLENQPVANPKAKDSKDLVNPNLDINVSKNGKDLVITGDTAGKLKNGEIVAVWAYSKAKFVGNFKAFENADGSYSLKGVYAKLAELGLTGDHRLALVKADGTDLGNIAVSVAKNGKMSIVDTAKDDSGILAETGINPGLLISFMLLALAGAFAARKKVC